MADLEIYVDGIASLPIQTMNAWIHSVRNKLIKDTNPGENDHYQNTLEASIINEDELFSKTLHVDLDSISQSIRKNHRNDSETATDTEIDMKLHDEILKIKKTNAPQSVILVQAVSEMLDVSYSSISTDKFKVLSSFLGRSKKLKVVGGSRRGRKK